MLAGMAPATRPAAVRVGHLLLIGGAEEKLRQRQILIEVRLDMLGHPPQS